MLSADVDYIGACIPQRQMELSAFAEGVRNGLSDRDAERYAAPLVDGPNVAEGISEVERVGCGFFILRREPLAKMLELDMVPRKVLKVPAAICPPTATMITSTTRSATGSPKITASAAGCARPATRSTPTRVRESPTPGR